MTAWQCARAIAVTCLIGAALIALVLLTGCSPPVAAAQTPLGIHVEGEGITARIIDDIDAGYLEAFDCWSRITERWMWREVRPEYITVSVEDVALANASGTRIRISPDEPYWVVRHEFSHSIGYHATGHTVQNYDGRCWL